VAQRSHNRWIRHQLGLDPIYEQTNLPTEIAQTIESIHEILYFYHQAEERDPTTLAIISELYKTRKISTKKDKREALHSALKASKCGHPKS